MHKSVLVAISLILFSIVLQAQNVYIPDTAFKDALLAKRAINLNSDDEIQLSEADSYSGGLDLSDRGIKYLTGIEEFTMCESIDCGSNLLTNLDFSGNLGLKDLECGLNQLSSINLTNNDSLRYLSCGSSGLSELDLSGNTMLTTLYCSKNELTSLDLSNNPLMDRLFCGYNSITSLEFPNNPILNLVECWNNFLTSLDISNNPELTILGCYYNSLTSLDLTNNINLYNLDCGSNQITSLDLTSIVSDNAQIRCDSNQLTSLNLSGGYSCRLVRSDTARCTAVTLHALDNPYLMCIQVDDSSWAADTSKCGVWLIGSTAHYSESCTVLALEDQLFQIHFLHRIPFFKSHFYKIGSSLRQGN